MNPAVSKQKEALRCGKGGVKSRLSLKRQERLCNSRQFKEVYLRGRRLNGPHLTLYFLPNELQFNRLGLTVSKKRFKLSPRRHHIKRRLREAYRLNKMRFFTGYDIIVSAIFCKGNALFDDLQNELLSLANQARLIRAETE